MPSDIKKLMLLGGLRYLIPVIETAHKLGIYVITVDYLPDNIAHRYSDEYHNISIINKEEVLRLAEQLNIDGIMSFAVDPGVKTASYVAEKLGLPFQGSYKSVSILQDKALFRQFLTDNDFNVPAAKGYDNVKSGLEDIALFKWPVIVKPVDSAGSKGVTKVEVPAELEAAIKVAINESHSGNYIIEEFLEKMGETSDTDCFTEKGELVYCSFSDQFFDVNAVNPYTPAAFSWPSSMPEQYQDKLKSEIQRLMHLLNMQTGIFNIETRVCKDGKAYIMEVSPRGGGNRLAEMLDIATDANLIENSVRAAVGLPLTIINNPEYKDYHAEIILHADKDGIFEQLLISEPYSSYVIEKDLWVEPGDGIKAFSGANTAIGTIVLRFPSKYLLDNAMSNISSWCKIIIK